MAENRKKKNQQKLPWWLTPVLLLVVLAIWFGGEALGRGFQWLSDSQTSESTTTAQKVPSDETLTVRFLDVGRYPCRYSFGYWTGRQYPALLRRGHDAH